MPGFFALVFFLLLGFAGLGLLLFQTSSYHYRSFMSALKTLFTAFLGNKDFRVMLFIMCLYVYVCIGAFCCNEMLADEDVYEDDHVVDDLIITRITKSVMMMMMM